MVLFLGWRPHEEMALVMTLLASSPVWAGVGKIEGWLLARRSKTMVSFLPLARAHSRASRTFARARLESVNSLTDSTIQQAHQVRTRFLGDKRGVDLGVVVFFAPRGAGFLVPEAGRGLSRF